MERFKKIKSFLLCQLKTYCFLGIFVFLILNIVSCNLPNIEKGKTNLSQEGNNYILIDSGKKIEVPNEFEILIQNSIITKMADHDDLQINIDLPKKEESLYFILLGNIRNISSSSINLSQFFRSSLIFDDNFQYEASFSANENTSELVPLKNENFIIYASVPIEILSSANHYEFRISIPPEYKKNISSNEIRFKGSVNQYGSPDNIANKHILEEMLDNLLESYPNILSYDDEFTVYYRIFGALSFTSFDSIDNLGNRAVNRRRSLPIKHPNYTYEYIIATPYLRYYYNEDHDEVDLIIKYENYSTLLDSSYSINAENISISSNNGTYENDDFSITFIRRADFDKLRNILQGDNLQFSIIHKDFKATEKIDNIFKETLLSLMDYYEKSERFLRLKNN